MSTEIVFEGKSEQARQALRTFVAILTGRHPDHFQIARSVFYVLGFQALTDIQADFLRKSAGGVGEDGVKWPPLSPAYLAYGRRFGKGEKAALKKAAGLDRRHSRGVGGKGGILTAQQQKRWNKVYSQTLAAMAARYDIAKAKQIAAGHAWNVIKSEGAKTKLEVYGNRQVDMLQDTGILIRSLSPGTILPDGSDYQPPTGEGGDQQIFRALSDGIVVGSNVAYADHQNRTRPFLPKEIPSAWQARWESTVVRILPTALRYYFDRSGGAAA
ncbi:hypothetical protein SH449x_004116 [Pirellulaceae bacterium SH449]